MEAADNTGHIKAHKVYITKHGHTHTRADFSLSC